MADSNHDQKTTREAERDVEAARANLAGSINDLEARLSPNALVEQGLAYFRSDGRRHLDTLVRNAQANPIPLVLIGIGVAWLALGSGSTASRRSSARQVRGDRPYDRDTYGYDREEYNSPSNAAATTSTSDLGASVTAASTMAGQPRTTGLGTETGSTLSDAPRNTPGPTSRLEEEADPEVSNDPLLRDSEVDEPVIGTSPAISSELDETKDTASFRDPIATAHSNRNDDKKL